MPRMSEAEKQRSHKRILDAAAVMLRENGVEATSVSDIMLAAGLTHGGFYRHFPSKDALVSAAFRHAVDDVLAGVESAATTTKSAGALDQYVESYLSPEHVRNRGYGCPLAAIGAEIGRTECGARREASAAVKRVVALLESQDNGAKGRATLAILVGTVMLARLAETESDTEAMLKAGRAAVALLQQH